MNGTTIRSRAAIVLVVLVAAAGLATYMWVASSGEEEASAQVVLGGACNQLQETDDYDVTATIRSTLEGEPLETVVYDGRISGDDYHIRITDLEGKRLAALKFVGGLGYERFGDGDWRVASHTFAADTAVWEVVGPNPSCPNVSLFRSLGQETNANGVTLSRYTDAPLGKSAPPLEDVPDFPGMKQSNQHEMWGRLPRTAFSSSDKYSNSIRGGERSATADISGRSADHRRGRDQHNHGPGCTLASRFYALYTSDPPASGHPQT